MIIIRTQRSKIVEQFVISIPHDRLPYDKLAQNGIKIVQRSFSEMLPEVFLTLLHELFIIVRSGEVTYNDLTSKDNIDSVPNVAIDVHGSLTPPWI